MNWILLLLNFFSAQHAFGTSAPPLPLEKQVTETYIDLVVVGTLTEVSTRTISITDRTFRPPKKRSFDTGVIAVKKALKGTAFTNSTIEVLFQSNNVVWGPPMFTPGREGVWLLHGSSHLSVNNRHELFGEYDIGTQPQIERALSEYAQQLDPVGYHNSERCPHIKPGVTKRELIAAFGKPFYVSPIQENKYQSIGFAASPIAPNKIWARASIESEKILELSCTGNISDRWHTD